MSDIERTDEGVSDLPTDTTEFYTTDTEGYLEEEEVEEFDLHRGPISYNTVDFISKPFMVDESTVAEDILVFDHSFGYDCKRYFNLVAADENTIIFASGNLIHFLDINSGKLTFRRSALGGGIGHIVKNPNPDYQHITIAENGSDPPIIIYDWPSFEIVCLLRGGAAQCFTNISYSPDGLLLVSQGGEPDNLITIWNWRESHIMLRTLSSTNDVYRVRFSPSVPGQLTTCGLAHIKFWKMARTFTGLKLKGELGRFGKTEYTDIIGIYPMPDEKVVSGCFWGNILIWDEGLIKLEVYRKLRKKCHEAPIVQFNFKDGELWTVSQDGHIKVWYYDTIDQADPPDDDRVVMLEPSYDFYTPDTELMYIIKQTEESDEPYYFAQDGNGGIWRIDLNTEDDPGPPKQLLKCHAGPVVDIAACPWGCFLASLGKDGRLYVYNYMMKTLILAKQFPAKGRCMIWLSMKVDPSGEVILLGFDDGNVRVGVLQMTPDGEMEYVLIQVTKPHHKSVTKMAVQERSNVLITGGEDATIFIYMIEWYSGSYITLIPIGFVRTPDPVSCLTWHRREDNIVIVGCIHGQIMEVHFPTVPQSYTTITYILKVRERHVKFVTYKAQIRRDIRIEQINVKKNIKRDKKRVEMERIMKDNPGLNIDEEVFLADSDSEEELDPLYIPPEPNRILWIQHLQHNGNYWLSMAGYDAGYIYQYNINQKDNIPIWFQMVKDADDMEITCFVYNYSKTYLIMGMLDGSIRVNKCHKDNYTNLTDYWKLSMHDNYNGFISKICFSYDEKYFFSCGYDGNIFSYRFNIPEEDYIVPDTVRIETDDPPKAVRDIHDPKTLSLEQAIVKKEEDRKFKVAEDHKKMILRELHALRKDYIVVLDKNLKLLPTQIIPRDQLEIDDRIAQHLRHNLSSDLELVKRKLAFQVERSEIGMIKMRRHFTDPLDIFPIEVKGVQNGIPVRTMRQRKLDKEFHELLKLVEEKIIEQEIRGRAPKRASIELPPPPPVVVKERQLEFFLLGLSPSTIQFKLGAKLNRLIYKYRMRKIKREKRQQVWDKFNNIRPIEGINHPDDEFALKEAESTIGDFKLKTALDYKVPSHLRASTVVKYKELLMTRLQQYEMRHEFNVKVYKMREKKLKLREELNHLELKLKEIHTEVPEHMRQHSVAADVQIKHIHDFPETNLECVVEFHDVKAKVLPIKKVVHGATLDLLQKEVLEFRYEPEFMQYELTPWEEESRMIRNRRKLYEQSLVIRAMNEVVEEFDNELRELSEERTKVMVDATFLDLHLLSLNQELIILKNFEAHEDYLSEKVHITMIELMDYQDIITVLNKKIESHKREVEQLQEDEKGITQQFMSNMNENKFFDFLRRIFKKKYRAPKIKKDDDESESDSSSESSSEEENDAGSIDSRDIGIIRLDDSVCPKGCDQALYDLTFVLRGQRHAVEFEIRERQKDIDLLRKDLEATQKKEKMIESNLAKSQTDLEEFQRIKQQKLNEVMCTVVVSVHQIQNINPNHKMESISQSLVFSKSVLTKLYKRVGQLQNETVQQKAKHKKYIKHLSRMTTDINHMNGKVEELHKKIIDLMKLKFGGLKPDFTFIEVIQGIEGAKKRQAAKKQGNIGLDEIEECVIKRLVFHLRMSSIDIRSMYESEMQLWKRMYAAKLQEHIDRIRQNTSRLELIGVLKKEIRELTKKINHQQIKSVQMDNVMDIAKKYKVDLIRLSTIVEEQRRELETLQQEIKRMRTKGMKQLEPIVFQTTDEMADDVSSDWSDYEGYFRKHNLSLDDGRHMEYFDGEGPEVEEQLAMTKFYEEEEQQEDQISNESVKKILYDLLNELELSEKVDEDLDQLITTISRRGSVAQIIDDILSMVNRQLSEEEAQFIEDAAEKLYEMQEPSLTSEERIECSRDILMSILQKVDENEIEMASILGELLENLPVRFLESEASLDLISETLGPLQDVEDINPSLIQLRKLVEGLPPGLIQDATSFLDKILQSVFDFGMDYLYVIDDPAPIMETSMDLIISPAFSEPVVEIDTAIAKQSDLDTHLIDKPVEKSITPSKEDVPTSPTSVGGANEGNVPIAAKVSGTGLSIQKDTGNETPALEEPQTDLLVVEDSLGSKPAPDELSREGVTEEDKASPK